MNTLFRGLLLFFSLELSGPVHAMTEIEEKIISQVDQDMPAALALLEKTVNINSGTMNPKGVTEVGRIFRDELDELGLETKWVALPPELKRAGHLFAETHGHQGKKLLLIGHLDTVFELDSPFQQCQFLGNTAIGPGIIDMKAGDVAIVYALRALKSVNALRGTQIIVAMMGDEEHAGRPTAISRQSLVDAAKRSDIALEFEFGGETIGKVVTQRRGVSRWLLEVTSPSSHSAGIFSDDIGAGAIFSAATILTSFQRDLVSEQDLTFNPGIILGGTNVEFDQLDSRGTAFGKENVIAAHVLVQGDLRFSSAEQESAARTRMKEIAANAPPKTQANLTFIDGYPAMTATPGNQFLLEQLSNISQEMGTGPITAFSIKDRGASDVAFVSAYVDALGGLGAIGGGAHTQDEYMDLPQFSGAIKRAALLIYRLTHP